MPHHRNRKKARHLHSRGLLRRRQIFQTRTLPKKKKYPIP
jgi:3-methylcrotonyl-CoA carboxylase alpha subunit